MGLKCLLGHDFTEPEIERAREEDGQEVVTTVREVKTCTRCGETQVVSENTEVTTIEQLTDQATSTGDAGDREPGRTVTSETERASSLGPRDGSTGVSETGSFDRSPEESGGLDRTTDDGGLNRTAGDLDQESVNDDAVILDDGPDESEHTGSADPTDTPASEAAGSNSSATGESTGGADPTVTPEEADVELIDDGPESDDRLAAESADEASTPASDAGDGELGEPGTGAENEDAETDDGVILDDEATTHDGERERGAWPTDDRAGDVETEPTPWPEQRGEDEGFSAEIGDGEDAGVEFGGGLTPESANPSAEKGTETEYVEAPDDGTTVETDDTSGDADASGADWVGRADETRTSDDSPDPGSGITRAESPDPNSRDPPDAPGASEYYCPECGMTMQTDGNSTRAGDICPECKRGYVSERPR